MAHYCVLLLLTISTTSFQLADCSSTTPLDPKRPPHDTVTIEDRTRPLTVATVMDRMRVGGVFDWKDPGLSPADKAAVDKLVDELEIWVLSRSRQPFEVQASFVNLRQIRAVIDNLFAQGSVERTLADKFHWDKVLGP